MKALKPDPKKLMLDRAEGCLLGQLAGDALGSLVEFETPDEIRKSYPNGVRLLADGGTWDTIAGQPTDDSEMALLLARSLVSRGTYDVDAARAAYCFWLNSGPFDCGATIAAGLQGRPNPHSQANGAMMRIAPLGIFGARFPLAQVAEWARRDAGITHPNFLCQQANALFTTAIAHAVKTGPTPAELYQFMLQQAEQMAVEADLLAVMRGAASKPPPEYLLHQGWVQIAFPNALWQLLHAVNLEEALVDTVQRGGDTDTNAAICGALLGAVYGSGTIPDQWQQAVLNCRPKAGKLGVKRPRPELFWPVDALELASQLLSG